MLDVLVMKDPPESDVFQYFFIVPPFISTFSILFFIKSIYYKL